MNALVKVENLVKDYPLPKKALLQKAPVFRALHGVNLTVEKATSYGIVGESGCGKSTLARIVMALDTPTEGTVYFKGKDLFKVSMKELNRLRKNFQMVFQDPYGSLNPRKNILNIVAEPMDTLEKDLTKKERIERVGQTLEEVGLRSGDLQKYPHEFSGGQRQRIAIARALITRPSLIVADESVSALDVSVQAQVLNLMMDLQEKYNLAYMFISHDLSVVEYITDSIAVIYLGRIVEQGITRDVFAEPLHPYTQTLFRAIPDIDPTRKKEKIKTTAKFAVSEKSCPFIDRCEKAENICLEQEPGLKRIKNRLVACHRV